MIENTITNKALHLQTKAQKVAALKARIAVLAAEIAAEEADIPAPPSIDNVVTIEVKAPC